MDAGRWRLDRRLSRFAAQAPARLSAGVRLSRTITENGLTKVDTFSQNKSKPSHLHFLTPKGIKDKARVNMRFLQLKLDEYESLERELAEIEREAGKLNESSADREWQVANRKS